MVMIYIMMLIAMVFISSILSIPFIIDFIKSRKGTIELEATIIDIEEVHTRLGIRYRPIYQYNYVGVDFEAYAPYSMYKSILEVNRGNKVLIKINPNNPEKIYEKVSFKDIKRNLWFESITTIIIVIIMFCVIQSIGKFIIDSIYGF